MAYPITSPLSCSGTFSISITISIRIIAIIVNKMSDMVAKIFERVFKIFGSLMYLLDKR